MIARDNHLYRQSSTDLVNVGVPGRMLRGGAALALIGYLCTATGPVTPADLAIVVGAVALGATAATGWDPLLMLRARFARGTRGPTDPRHGPSAVVGFPNRETPRYDRAA